MESDPSSVLIMLDRSLDLVTPFLVGFSYEALIDYFYEIKMNKIRV